MMFYGCNGHAISTMAKDSEENIEIPLEVFHLVVDGIHFPISYKEFYQNQRESQYTVV